jgi:hypothetical protein
VCCAAAIAAASHVGLRASPQDPAGGSAESLARIKERLERPAARPLKPSSPVHLRPVFRSRATDRPFVPTLDEHLRDTFTLTDFQRQYAKYAAACCGLDIGGLFRAVDRALEERRERKVREQVASELAIVEAAEAKKIR